MSSLGMQAMGKKLKARAIILHVTLCGQDQLYVAFLVHMYGTVCSVCDEIWHLRGALRQLLYGDITYGTHPYNLCNYFLYEIPGQ